MNSRPFRSRLLAAALLLGAAGLVCAQPAPAAGPAATPQQPQLPQQQPGQPGQPTPPPGAGQPRQQVMPPPSRDAQRAYETTRDKLVQIRTLLRNTDTQSSVGSGFFVSAEGLIISNFHVAAQLALEPERYRGVYVPVDGKQAELELLAFDVQHDLAVLRPKVPIQGQPALEFRAREEPLARGERIYSLGNPLDIGFAVTEGTYNGLVQRSFYPRIFFGGALNPGMSGGPALDEAGRVVGVNVAKRQDGELLSFLIPGQMAQALLERARDAKPIVKPAHAEIARQLQVHQALVSERFLNTPLREQKHGGYSVPVPDAALARCWGRGRDPDFRAFDLERTDCRIDSHVFAGEFNTGFIQMRYEAYEAPRLSQLRFATMYSASFKNERFATRGSRKKTPAECTERFIDRDGMAMRAVICMNAYRKFPGLYDMSVLVASLNQPKRGVQGRLDAQGVGFDNSLKIADAYLAGFRWEGSK